MTITKWISDKSFATRQLYCDGDATILGSGTSNSPFTYDQLRNYFNNDITPSCGTSPADGDLINIKGTLKPSASPTVFTINRLLTGTAAIYLCSWDVVQFGPWKIDTSNAPSVSLKLFENFVNMGIPNIQARDFVFCQTLGASVSLRLASLTLSPTNTMNVQLKNFIIETAGPIRFEAPKYCNLECYGYSVNTSLVDLGRNAEGSLDIEGGIFKTDQIIDRLSVLANFTWDKIGGGHLNQTPFAAENQPIQFTSTSQLATTYDWDFGDGIHSSAQNPQHTFNANSSNNVTLTINGGLSTITKNIVISPQALYSWDSSIDVGNHINQNPFPYSVQPIQFTDQSVGATSWLWDFGDTHTSALPSPTHSFAGGSTYDVTLTINGGVDSVTNHIIVSPQPVARFNWDSSIDPGHHINENPFQLGEEPIQFIDTSVASSSWLWDFGDTHTSALPNPTHTFSAGTYTVTLTINGGASSVMHSITVSSVPLSRFIWDSSVEPGSHLNENPFNFVKQPVAFFDTSISATSWAWDFGDTHTSTLQNPTHTFASGTFTVTLVINSGASTSSQSISISSAPEALFDWDATGGGFHNTSPIQANLQPIVFTDNSISPTSWLWTFGDTQSSTLQNPTHTYASTGTYTVTLSINGGYSSVAHNITISSAPLARFTWDSSVDPGNHINENPFNYVAQPIQFSDTSISATSWLWDFGDSHTSTSQNPTHSFSSGTFTVSLTINGGISTTSISLGISTAPAAFFSWDSSVDPGHHLNQTPISATLMPIQFIDQSVAVSSWLWSFGDGNTSTSQNPTHTYTTNTTFTVTLTINGGPAVSHNITITAAPVAQFTYDSTVDVGHHINQSPFMDSLQPIQFTDTSTGAVSWAWDFGDTHSSTLQNPPHTFASTGTYTVLLSINSGISTFSRTIVVSSTPTALFGWDSVPQVGNYINTSPIPSDYQPVQFTDHSIAATSWLWDFGDTHTSTSQNPTHTYTSINTYTVTLTINGGVSTITHSLQISQAPVANFGWDSDANPGDWTNVTPYNIDAGALQFTDTSIDSSSWYWQFGDGHTSTLQNPVYEYTAIGTYNVTLQINSNRSNITKTIVVFEPPIAFFEYDSSVDPHHVNENPFAFVLQPIQFTDHSTGAYSWSWDFGDGNTSTLQNPTHTYTSLDSLTYTVTLTINGSGPYFSKTFTILTARSVNFGWDSVADPGHHIDQASMLPSLEPIQFIDRSTYVTSWHWDFGDSNTSTLQNPQHTYASTGTYNITLYINGFTGLSLTKTLIITNPPVASFNYDSHRAPGTLTNSSPWVNGWDDPSLEMLNTSTAATSYTWTFGDGTGTFTDVNPVHQYTTDGTYTITLTAINGVGTSTATRMVTIELTGCIVWYTANNTPNDYFNRTNMVWENATAAYIADPGYDNAFHFTNFAPPDGGRGLQASSISQLKFSLNAQFTIKCRIKRGNTANHDVVFFVLKGKMPGSSLEDYGLGIDDNNGAAQSGFVRIWTGNVNEPIRTTGRPIDTDTDWYDIVWTYNAGTHHIYTNRGGAGWVDQALTSNFKTLARTSDNPLGIAYGKTSGNTFFSGNIDEVQIFNGIKNPI